MLTDFRVQNGSTEQELQDETKALVVAQEGYLIECNGDYEMAAEIIKGYSAQIARVEEWFEDPISKANAAHKALTGRRAETLGPLKVAKKALGETMGAWNAKMKAQAKAEAEMIRAIEEEDAKKELEELAAGLDESGEKEAAEVVREQKEHVYVPAKVEQLAPKVKGTRSGTIWEYEIVDTAAIPATFMIIDEKAIAAIVRHQKDATNIPGVRVFSREQMY